eukprot:CAMPEP_0194158040 /NCGR_PEP_ID=MMETSP0152-20130528/74434_1 /TAXON_ID=1049557 /ORGANISM="Thalassiothrix antarctica, Strain L6-D1" /LENGTH=118 /DNA_ID=CAMNT_0038866941 /DNA_START=33 /DNA_END=385 /DNA_ORIENTATION=-
MPWMVRDITNDPSCFVVEIPTDDPKVVQNLTQDAVDLFSDKTSVFDSVSLDREDSSRHLLRREEEMDSEEDLLDHKKNSRNGNNSSSSLDGVQHNELTLSVRAKLEADFKASRSAKRP